MSPHSIISLVADASNVTVEQILSNRRPWYIVLPRWKAMWLCRELYPSAPLTNIAEWFKKHPDAVRHALRTIGDLPARERTDLPELKERCLGKAAPPSAPAWAGTRLLLQGKGGKVQEFKVVDVISGG
jgi:hypothetical protein